MSTVRITYEDRRNSEAQDTYTDGTIGTMIQAILAHGERLQRGFADAGGMMKGNNDMLNITRPDVVADIHRKYL